MRLPAVGDRVGHYRVVRRVGGGSFGTVLEVEHEGRPYALKLFHDCEHEDWALREVAVLLHVRHPNVVRLLGFGRWPEAPGGRPYLLLELVRGRPLGAWLRQANPTAREVAQLVLKLARALGEVHRQGVLHRDIKESNVLVRDSDGEPVLLDFSAGFHEGARTATLLPLPPGTLEYRSPEAWRHVRQSAGQVRYQARPSDDWWALGVMLYSLLTGHLPFAAGQGQELAEAVLEGFPIPPHRRNPLVPAALGALCLRMLEARLEERLADEASICDALEAALAEAGAAWDGPVRERASSGSSSLAPEPSPQDQGAPQPAPRQGRRWPPAVVGAVSVALLAAAACVVLLWMARTARMARTPPAQSVAMARHSARALPAVPSTSPTTPSATAPKEARRPMRDFKRALIAATTTVTLTGCATPKAPSPAEPTSYACPRENIEWMKAHQLVNAESIFDFLQSHENLMIRGRALKYFVVRNGPALVKIERINLPETDPVLQVLPLGTKLSGNFILGKTRVYGHFTRAHLADGSVVPVCFELTGVDDDFGETAEAVLPGGMMLLSSKGHRIVGIGRSFVGPID